MIRSRLRKKPISYHVCEYISEASEASTATQLISKVSIKTGTSKAVILSASINWQTPSYRNKYPYTETIFQIWRGSPVPKNLICSVKDSCSGANISKATTFTHVDAHFEPSKEIVYILTAETSKSENMSKKINCVAFTAELIPLFSQSISRI